MTEKTFEYGGLHFTPIRQFAPEENDIKAITAKLRTDKELGFCKKGYVYPSKFNYSHSDFYAAATDKKCDIFRCEENGNLYVPCENDMQEYCDVSEISNNMADMIDSVVSSVKQEFETFKQAEKEKSVDEVFDDHYRIYFYCRVANYFQDADFCFYDRNEIKELAKYNGDILRRLYDFYIDCDEARVESYLETYQLIRSYNGYCHAVASGEME